MGGFFEICFGSPLNQNRLRPSTLIVCAGLV